MTSGTNSETETSTITTAGDSNQEQPQATTTDTTAVPESQFKELQAEYTRRNQELISTKVELAKRDPKTILDIKDTKLQNKVVQEIYGLNNIKEVELLHGKNFYEQNDSDEGNGDELSQLKKKVALLEFNSEVGKVSQGIKEFKKLNPDLFKDNPNAEEELRDKMSLLSKDIPVDERIEMASKLAFGVGFVNPTVEAYKALQGTTAPAGSGGVETKEDPKKAEVEKRREALREFFKSQQ